MDTTTQDIVPTVDPTKPNDPPTLVPVEKTVQGMKMVVEHPKGSTRTGKHPDGSEWKTNMLADYGFLPKGNGEDGEGLDAYVGPDDTSKEVHVIHQNGADGKYDEDKVHLNFPNADAAKASYLAHMPAEKYRSHTTMPLDTFKSMLTKAEPGSAHWKKKNSRKHGTTAMLSADKNLLITTYGVETPEVMNQVIEFARVKLAQCPSCGTFDVERKPGGKLEGPKDKCKFCGKIFSAKPGSLTAEQHAAKQTEFARQNGLGQDPYPDTPGTTDTAGFTENDPPVEPPDDEEKPGSDDDQEGQSNTGDTGEDDLDLSKIPGMPNLLSRAAKANFKTE